MLALNPVSPERFLAEDGGGKCEQVAHKWLQKTTELDIPGLKGFHMEWHGSPVSHHVKGTLGYVQWNEDGTLLVNVPYPKTPYQLEVFLHELGHIWKNHSPQKACNGKTRNCRPGNREEYEAETFAMDIMRKEGVEISADILEDAQDNVVNSLFRDAEDGLPVSRDAIKFVQINDRLQTHKGWENFLEAVEDRDMPVINPGTSGSELGPWEFGEELPSRRDYAAEIDALNEAISRTKSPTKLTALLKKRAALAKMSMGNPATPEQYRLAQAVLHGTARTVTRMTPEAAHKIIEDTPAYLRSEYSRYSTNPGVVKRRMSAEEMALTPHEMKGGFAVLEDGSQWIWDKRFEHWALWKLPIRSNPAEESAEVYEEFHGRPSEQVVEVEEAEHYHSHLAELGTLRGLKFRTVDGSDDVTLDFDCEDCDHGQSGNLWGFGGGEKKPKTKRKRFGVFGKKLTTHSSSLMRSAYDAGYKGIHGYRGQQQFHEWLERAPEDLDRAFERRLAAEYNQGVRDWERDQREKEQREIVAERAKAQQLLDRKLAQQRREREQEEKREARERRGDTFQGYDIKPASGGGFVVPSLDRDSVFDTIADAKRFIQARSQNPRRKGPLASAREFVGQMGSGVTQGVDSFFTGNPAVTYETVSRMTAGQINKELDKIDKQRSDVNRQLIDAGYGHLRMSEISGLDHPLARREEDLYDKYMILRREVDRRYGPGAPSRLPSGRGFGPLKNPAGDDGPVILCSNEDKNQLYLVGGDQAVDLGELNINGRHDSVILGQCWAVSYSTEKSFDDFERIEYVHTFAPDKLQRRMSERADLWEDAKPPYQEAFESGDLPTLRYDVLNQTLHFDGGSYFVTDKGIED